MLNQDIIKGILLDEETELSLNDLCKACSCSAEWIIELVNEGVLEPVNYQQTRWSFTGDSLQIAQTAMRLQRDLGVNLAGIALTLELMQQIDKLESRLSRLEIMSTKV